MLNNPSSSSLKEAHRTNILKTLQHRLEVAKNQGKTALVAQLEAERSYYLK